MKFSIIITAWKEPESVNKNLELILNPENDNRLPNSEIILACPDKETYDAAKRVIAKYNFNENFLYIKDPQLGKPHALNLAFSASKGEILICMDGDVFVGKKSLKHLVNSFEKDNKIGAVSGRPVSIDYKDSMFGYWGNLLADAAHFKRFKEYSKSKNYFLSGYLFAMRKIKGLKIPEDILSDDAWISIKLISMGYSIAYSSNSYVYIKYPKNFHDWLKQKRRSVGGYVQLNQYLDNDIKSKLPKRNFFEEFKYFFFPLTYAKNIKQLMFSLALYLARVLLWSIIFYDKLRKNHSAKKLWKRVDSTK